MPEMQDPTTQPSQPSAQSALPSAARNGSGVPPPGHPSPAADVSCSASPSQLPAQSALTEAVFHILLALWGGPMHGYGIMQHTGQLSGGRLSLGPGTLYGALNTLMEKGWIAAAGSAMDARGKKEYALTPTGRAAARAELARLQNLAAAAQTIMEEEHP